MPDPKPSTPAQSSLTDLGARVRALEAANEVVQQALKDAAGQVDATLKLTSELDGKVAGLTKAVATLTARLGPPPLSTCPHCGRAQRTVDAEVCFMCRKPLQ